MKYSLNDYHPYLAKHCVRLDVIPNRNVAAKLVNEYKASGFETMSIADLLSPTNCAIPTPSDAIKAIKDFIRNHDNGVVITGLDAYMAFLRSYEITDFIQAIRSMIDHSNGNARLLMRNNSDIETAFANPKYRDGLLLVELDGETDSEQSPSIRIFPSEWVLHSHTMPGVIEAINAINAANPADTYNIMMPNIDMPPVSYRNVSVIRSAAAVLSDLYGIHANVCESDALTLLEASMTDYTAPMNLLTDRFGNYPTKEGMAHRLKQLTDDKLWNFFIWMVRGKIPENCYLSKVLQDTEDADHYWQNYVVHTACACLGHPDAKAFAAERAVVLRGSSDTLINRFVEDTIDDDRAIPFLNCETDFEMAGLIRHAAKGDLAYGLHGSIKTVAPILDAYLANDFDYGHRDISTYFSTLRCMRMGNIINDDFVNRAYTAQIPPDIPKRDDIIGGYDDGETALLVIDGIGAEYYPLLINFAKKDGISILEKRIVRANLPTSTKFNPIKWKEDKTLQPVKRADSISHEGYSAHEASDYSENLAEIFRVFRRDIMPRIETGLRSYNRVLVTADHGASYLAVTAYKQNMTKTLPWDGTPDDWRYAALDREIETPDGMVRDYHAAEKKTYYIIKGYNRLPRIGGKKYGLHGGATLEEVLVPFVLFTKDAIIEENGDQPEQLIENDDFDI